MAFADEFDTQWNSIEKFLESEMIAQSERKEGIDIFDIEQKLDNEKKRWSVPGQFNYKWIELLRKENPGIAEEFMEALDGVRFEQVKMESCGNASSSLIPAVGGAAIGLAAGYFISHVIIVTGIAAIVGGAAGGFIGNGLNQKKKYEANKEIREQYVKQLQNMQGILRAIVKKAEA